MTGTRDASVRDWELERYRLGELPREECERIDLLLAGDAGLRERIAAFDAQDAALLAQLPARVLAAHVQLRMAATGEPAAARRLRPVFAWAGAAAAVVLAAGLYLVPREGPRSVGGEGIKGLRPHMMLYRKTADGAERLGRTSVARANDVIQLAYQGAGRHFGVIVSVDGRGVVTRHLPADGARAAELQPGTVVLPAAYRLDDAPRWECFYLIAADAPFDVTAIAEAARRAWSAGEAGAPLDVPSGLDQEVFVLKKDTQS